MAYFISRTGTKIQMFYYIESCRQARYTYIIELNSVSNGSGFMNAYKTYRQKRTSEMRPFYQFLRKTQQNVICQPVNFYRRSWEILLKASHHTGKMRYQAIMGNEEVPSHRNEWKLLIDARRVCKVSRALERLGSALKCERFTFFTCG